MVGELKNNEVSEYEVQPSDVGLKVCDAAALRVDGINASKAMLLAALGNQDSPARDIVAFNAGASIYVAGLADTLADGVEKALAILASGTARKKLDQFVTHTSAIQK